MKEEKVVKLIVGDREFDLFGPDTVDEIIPAVGKLSSVYVALIMKLAMAQMNENGKNIGFEIAYNFNSVKTYILSIKDSLTRIIGDDLIEALDSLKDIDAKDPNKMA